MSLDVRGGEGGIRAELDDLLAAATRIAWLAEEVADVLAAVLRRCVDQSLLATAPVSGATAAGALAALARVAGPGGLAGEAAALAALGHGVRGAVAAYEQAEAVVGAMVETAQDAAVAAASTAAATAVPAALVLVACRDRHRAAGSARPAQSASPVVPRPVGWSLEAADRVLFRLPWLADLAGGVEGLGGLSLWRPETSYEDALGLLVAAAAPRGWLSERKHPGVAAVPLSSVRLARPRGVAGLLAAPGGEAGGDRSGLVRVLRLPQRGGGSAWVVQLPGTQSWSLRPGANPHDLTSDVLLMAHRRALLTAGVEAALRDAQARTGSEAAGEPVLLAGHSLGGIVAASLAASPSFRSRHHVTHVVTSGAPLARLAVPASVSVLALEHRQDPVPRLEGAPNPDRPGWVTVTRDLGGSATTGALAPGAGASATPDAVPGAGRASGAHTRARYAATAAAVDADPARSLRAWRASAWAFLGDEGGDAVVHEYRLRRLGDP